jgi:hypothetical protein
MRLKEVNYYGLDHAKVNEKFKGDLTYLRTFTIRGHHWAVYHAANPNRALGHKDYMMLGSTVDMADPQLRSNWYVSGSILEEMAVERVQEAVLCTKCDTIIYSINRHHFHYCPCGAVFVDGGKDYLCHGGEGLRDLEIVKIDLVDGTLVEHNGLTLETPIKLEVYSHSDENPEDKVSKKRRNSHRSEKLKKGLTAGRKSGKIKTTRKVKK